MKVKELIAHLQTLNPELRLSTVPDGNSDVVTIRMAAQPRTPLHQCKTLEEIRKCPVCVIP